MPSPRSAVVPRSVEDLADARELRAAISLRLSRSPINDDALRCAVWTFDGTERRAGVPPALVGDAFGPRAASDESTAPADR